MHFASIKWNAFCFKTNQTDRQTGWSFVQIVQQSWAGLWHEPWLDSSFCISCRAVENVSGRISAFRSHGSRRVALNIDHYRWERKPRLLVFTKVRTRIWRPALPRYHTRSCRCTVMIRSVGKRRHSVKLRRAVPNNFRRYHFRKHIVWLDNYMWKIP